MAKIAVETPFEDVKQALEEKGHTVKMFESDENIHGYDLGVVRSFNEANSSQFDFPLVSIEGLSVNEIVESVENKLNR